MIRISQVKRIGTACAALVLIVGLSGCDKLKSRDHLNKGVAAFKAARYADAVEHFKTAIALDSSNPNARLYLATAYMQQWIPGAVSPENDQMAKQARDEFLKVLEEYPNEKTALASLASLAYNQATSLSQDEKQKMLDEAAKWNNKIIEVDPKDKEAYYMLGVISWAKWYPQLMTARANLRMKPEDPGPIKDQKVKEDLKAQYSSIIEQGTQDLQKALGIDPEYDDAMAYMNLLVRERADLADNPEAYKKQIQIADSWVQKALDTKKIKAARQPTTNGIVAEPN
jgi:tetratricopeptide (TPR) repeat protein